MTVRNDITGDLIKSRPTTKAYEDGYDRIFKKPRYKIIEEHTDGYMLCECLTCGEEFSNIDAEKDLDLNELHQC